MKKVIEVVSLIFEVVRFDQWLNVEDSWTDQCREVESDQRYKHSEFVSKW